MASGLMLDEVIDINMPLTSESLNDPMKWNRFITNSDELRSSDIQRFKVYFRKQPVSCYV